jgi:biopolymer transport protein ExbD
MKLTRTKDYHFGWLGVVSMIDIVFLLIFFVSLAQTSSSSRASQFRSAVALLAWPAGQSANHQHHRRRRSGSVLPRSKGRARSARPVARSGEDRRAPVIIKADRATPYELVVAVTNAALERGITSVSLATAPTK